MEKYWKLFCFTSYLIACIDICSAETTDVGKENLLAQFKAFVVRYNRSYINDPTEYDYRLKVFEDSLSRQVLLNKRERELKGSAVYGINKLSDWTREEFIDYLSIFNNQSSLNKTAPSCCHVVEDPSSLPTAWDWRKNHKVTRVKDQGKCGSCWAFSATGVVETQWAIANNMASPPDLSVQEFVSCSHNAGCKGGSISKTLKWLENARYDSGGKLEKYYLVPASEYPYEERDSTCNYANIEPKRGAKITCACSRDFKGEERVLANYVCTNGSLAVGVNAVLWHDYIGGIIQHHCTDSVINHAVIIEGFDMSGDIPYWIVRNSWGSDFGINGYLYLKMFENICEYDEVKGTALMKKK